MISVTQCLNSQSVTVSGNTAEEGSHYHGKGTFKITGSITGLGGFMRSVNTSADSDTSGCLLVTFTGNKVKTMALNSDVSDYTITRVDVDTSLGGWSGNTGSGSNHKHSFSTSATIGSGNYIRPNSRSCRFYIKY